MLKKLLLLAILTATFSAAQTPDITIERNVAMKTRDGITLHADIYRQPSDAKFPVLLQRTPYDKTNGNDFGRRAAARGYLVVIQDVRGRYTSEGEWYTFKHETDDGYDTIEWAAALPNSNGKVGMFGGSYVGATQMLAAIGHPPHLAGICPVVTASNYHENWTYHGGAFEQWFNESWGSGLAQDTANRAIRLNTNALVGDMVLPLTQYPIFNMKPISSPADMTRQLAPYFIDWATHTDYDSYWKQWSIEENYANIQVPALTIAAWYDIFQGGSLRNYLGLKAHAGNEAARANQKLLITIGGHAGGGSHIGTVDFGAAAADYDENSITLDWYDYLFLGKQNDFATNKPVKFFVMGDNKWRNEDTWPLERAKSTRYFLHSAGKSNTATGDGTLSATSAHSEPADSFTYDPANPVPTVGGPLCCDPQHLPAGPRDQKEVEARPDVLIYSTPPLAQDTEVTGPVLLDLFAKSSAVDTDFTAKLVDVHLDGVSHNVLDRVVRASLRNGSKLPPDKIESGKSYEYTIALGNAGTIFRKGHLIRLEISSSNFPHYARNLNTGENSNFTSETAVARQTVLHDEDHPSRLVLSVAPDVRAP